jgi:AcrR family transcriptional regulator
LSEPEPGPQPRAAPYHHGDLRVALLRAGEEELAEKGYAGFTLRGTAKRAGVSHAAPAHHFRDARALLAALAARGFERLSAEMRAAHDAAAPDPRAQLIASGTGYCRFGVANPALLQLMFGPERQPSDDPELERAGVEAFGILVGDVSAYQGAAALDHPAGRALIAACWSIVHGFTSLALAQRLGFLGVDDATALEGELGEVLGALLPARRSA